MDLLQMSVHGAVMILVVVVLRAWLKNRLPKKTFLALWAVVLLRLLLPFSLPSPFSVYSLVGGNLPAAQALGQASPSGGMPALSPAELSPTATAQPSSFPLSLFQIIWAAGFVLCLLFFAIIYFRCRREFRESLPVQTPVLTQWISSQKLCAALLYGNPAAFLRRSPMVFFGRLSCCLPTSPGRIPTGRAM